MSRKIIFSLAVVLSLILGLGPIGVAIWYGYKSTIVKAEDSLLSIVTGISNSSDLTLQQIRQGFAQLQQVTAECTPQDIMKLRDFVFDLPYLTAANVVDPAGNIVCSSWGKLRPPPFMGTIKKKGKALRIVGPIKVPVLKRESVVVMQARPDGSALHAVLSPKIMSDGLIGDIGNRGFAAIMRYHDGHPFAKKGSFSPIIKINEWDDSDKKFIRLQADYGDGIERYAIAMPLKFLPNTYVVVAVSDRWLLQNWTRNAIVMGLLGLTIAGLLIYIIVLLARRRLSMAADIMRGLKQNEFCVYYQPVVDLRQQNKVVGAEALIRWQHKDKGLLLPGAFIAAAEKSHLIEKLTAWIIQQAAMDLADVLQQHENFHLSFNISPRHMNSNELIPMVDNVLAKSAIQPKQIIFELIERGLINNQHSHVKENMAQLQQRNIQLAVDDFGTGYSSLSYISSFPLSYLKIDKSFVDAIGTESVTSGLVDTIIDMANQLNLLTIAEGIETQEQLDYLTGRGVHWAQGFYFAKPMPAKDLLKNYFE